MRIWLPSILYQVFPLISVLVGFGVAMFIQNPIGIMVAILLYIYSFYVLWMRSPIEYPEEA